MTNCTCRAKKWRGTTKKLGVRVGRMLPLLRRRIVIVCYSAPQKYSHLLYLLTFKFIPALLVYCDKSLNLFNLLLLLMSDYLINKIRSCDEKTNQRNLINV